jgi:hypothetical protein
LFPSSTLQPTLCHDQIVATALSVPHPAFPARYGKTVRSHGRCSLEEFVQVLHQSYDTLLHHFLKRYEEKRPYSLSLEHRERTHILFL